MQRFDQMNLWVVDNRVEKSNFERSRISKKVFDVGGPGLRHQELSSGAGYRLFGDSIGFACWRFHPVEGFKDRRYGCSRKTKSSQIANEVAARNPVVEEP